MSGGQDWAAEQIDTSNCSPELKWWYMNQHARQQLKDKRRRVSTMANALAWLWLFGAFAYWFLIVCVLVGVTLAGFVAALMGDWPWACYSVAAGTISAFMLFVDIWRRIDDEPTA